MGLKFDFDAAVQHIRQQLPDGYSLEITIEKKATFLQVWDTDGNSVFIDDANVSTMLQSITKAKDVNAVKMAHLFPKNGAKSLTNAAKKLRSK